MKRILGICQSHCKILVTFDCCRENLKQAKQRAENSQKKLFAKKDSKQILSSLPNDATVEKNDINTKGNENTDGLFTIEETKKK